MYKAQKTKKVKMRAKQGTKFTIIIFLCISFFNLYIIFDILYESSRATKYKIAAKVQICNKSTKMLQKYKIATKVQNCDKSTKLQQKYKITKV